MGISALAFQKPIPKSICPAPSILVKDVNILVSFLTIVHPKDPGIDSPKPVMCFVDCRVRGLNGVFCRCFSGNPRPQVFVLYIFLFVLPINLTSEQGRRTE